MSDKDESSESHIKRINAEREGTALMKEAGLVNAFELKPLFDERAVRELGLTKYMKEVDPHIK